MSSRYMNKDLAQDYFIVATKYCTRVDSYRTLQQRIEQLDIDMPSYFMEHGSFDDLEIMGIGKKTKKILESILEDIVKKQEEPFSIQS